MLEEGDEFWENIVKTRGPIKVYEYTDGPLQIVNGHHRFIAAQMTDTKIPWGNKKIVKVIPAPDKVRPKNIRDWIDYKVNDW